MASGARLQGIGTLGAVAINGGTIAPGDSIGHMTVASLVLSSSSVYENEISPTATDLLTANPGPVVLAGTLSVIPLPGSYPSGASYLIISNPLPIATHFGQVTSTNPRFTFTVAYNTPAEGDVLLSFGSSVVPFAQIVTTSNAHATAVCFDTIDGNPNLQDVLSLINFYPSVDQINAAFDQMNPSLYNGLFISQESVSLSVRQTVSQRQSEFNTSCLRFPNSNLFWAIPFGAISRQASQGELVGFNTAMGGLSFGFDRLWEQWLGGLAGTYTYNHVNWNASQAKADIQSGYASLYATRFSEQAFFNAIVTGAYNHYTADRNLYFPANMGMPAVTRNASNSHNGAQASGRIDLGGTFDASGIDLVPSLGLDAIYTYSFGYTENGAGALDLSVQSKHQTLLRADGGFTLSRCIREGENKRVQFGLRYAYETRFGGKNTSASFVDSSCVFTVFGLHPTRHLLIPTFSLIGTSLEERLSFAVNYEAEFQVSFSSSLGKKYLDQNLQLQIGYSF